jgi:hypothetical protein
VPRCIRSWPGWEEFLDPGGGESRDVRSCASKFAVEFPLVGQKLVPLGEEVFVVLAEPVAVVFKPGSVGVAQLSHEVRDELAVFAEFAAEAADLILGV